MSKTQLLTPSHYKNMLNLPITYSYSYVLLLPTAPEKIDGQSKFQVRGFSTNEINIYLNTRSLKHYILYCHYFNGDTV